MIVPSKVDLKMKWGPVALSARKDGELVGVSFTVEQSEQHISGSYTKPDLGVVEEYLTNVLCFNTRSSNARKCLAEAFRAAAQVLDPDSE